MIKLDAQFVTTVTTSLGGVVTESVTDTLFVQSVSLDFVSGTINALVQRGQGGASGSAPFSATMDPVALTVQSNGVFTSNDGSWSGTVPGFAAFWTQLKATFDSFILASGEVTGAEF
jgi:hypothetical protein